MYVDRRARAESAFHYDVAGATSAATERDWTTVLEFEITGEDLVAYNVYGVTTAPAAKKQGAVFRIWGSLAVLVALTILIAIDGSWLEGLVFGVVGAAALWFVWPRLWIWTTKSNVLRHAKTGGLGTPGLCRIWTDEYGIHDATPNGTSSVTWQGIDRVEETASHVFIFTGPLQAYVIPKRIGESAVRDFVSAVRAGTPR